jgi:hypothetical protein
LPVRGQKKALSGKAPERADLKSNQNLLGACLETTTTDATTDTIDPEVAKADVTKRFM